MIPTLPSLFWQYRKCIPLHLYKKIKPFAVAECSVLMVRKILVCCILRKQGVQTLTVFEVSGSKIN